MPGRCTRRSSAAVPKVARPPDVVGRPAVQQRHGPVDERLVGPEAVGAVPRGARHEEGPPVSGRHLPGGQRPAGEGPAAVDGAVVGPPAVKGVGHGRPRAVHPEPPGEGPLEVTSGVGATGGGGPGAAAAVDHPLEGGRHATDRSTTPGAAPPKGALAIAHGDDPDGRVVEHGGERCLVVVVVRAQDEAGAAVEREELIRNFSGHLLV